MEHHHTREKYRSPLIATDIIIRPRADPASGIVIIERKNLPYGIALPGGMAEHGLTLVQNAIKEAKEETNLEVAIDTPGRPFLESSHPSRDTRDHVISITYTGVGTGTVQGGDDAKNARVYSVPELKELVFYHGLEFDHNEVVGLYLREKGLLVDASDGHFSRLGMIGRFRPVHNDHATLLRKACDLADNVIIGIGSTNKYDARNPFTPQETREMIQAVLAPRTNYEFRFIPDFGDQDEYRNGQRWTDEVAAQFGSLDAFLTGNPYVAELVGSQYRVLHPMEILGPTVRPRIKGSMMRDVLRTEGYAADLPPEVNRYLAEHHIIDRFRHEFGMATPGNRPVPETLDGERERVRGGA